MSDIDTDETLGLMCNIKLSKENSQPAPDSDSDSSTSESDTELLKQLDDITSKALTCKTFPRLTKCTQKQSYTANKNCIEGHGRLNNDNSLAKQLSFSNTSNCSERTNSRNFDSYDIEDDGLQTSFSQMKLMADERNEKPASRISRVINLDISSSDDDLEHVFRKLKTPKNGNKPKENQPNRRADRKHIDSFSNKSSALERRFSKTRVSTGINKENKNPLSKNTTNASKLNTSSSDDAQNSVFKNLTTSKTRKIPKETQSCKRREHRRECDSSTDDEDALEMFLNKMKTSAVSSKKENPISLSEFVVSDDDVTTSDYSTDEPDADDSDFTDDEDDVFVDGSGKTEKRQLNYIVSSSDSEVTSRDKQLTPPHRRKLLTGRDRTGTNTTGTRTAAKTNTGRSSSRTGTSIPGKNKPRTTSTNRPLACSTSSGREQQKLHFLASLSDDVPMELCHEQAKRFRCKFGSTKKELVNHLFKLYNKEVFNDLIPSDFKICWNVRLLSTAGYYKHKRKETCVGHVELSTKVCDTPGRVRDVLIHELCHAITWQQYKKGGHGHVWKSWAAKANKVFPDLPVITRCHSYKIEKKFTYKCVNCNKCYSRHSKSLDLNRHRCGVCKGVLELFINKSSKSTTEGGSGSAATANLVTPRKPSAFALYVKGNYSAVRSSQKGMSHADTMKKLSADFVATKL